MTEPITITPGTYVEIVDVHGDNWFPFHVRSGLYDTTVYFKRAQLTALRDRLNGILGDNA